MSRNSEFLRHTSCGNCGSSDALAIYTDHEYCFSCGYSSKTSWSTKRTQTEVKKSYSINLPDDCEPYIPAVALDWLNKYGLRSDELLANRVLWSDKRNLLVFPYFGENDYNLLGWQGRYFGTDPKHPKWFTKGYIKDFIKTINFTEGLEHGIIYVEDIVSAIKVGRQFGSCPVFGSFIPKTHSIRLNKLGIEKFYIWLDSDKYREAHKFCKEIRDLGLDCKVIYTDKDPKEQTDEKIKELINSS